MTGRRDAQATRLLDPVWHALTAARDRLYREIEPGATDLTVSLACRDADGVVVSYTISLAEPAVIHRHVIPDEEGAAAAYAAHTIDATIEQGPG